MGGGPRIETYSVFRIATIDRRIRYARATGPVIFRHEMPSIEYLSGEDHDDPEDYLKAINSHQAKQNRISLSVELALAPDSPNNDSDLILDFIKVQFEKLLPLYRFTSWHRKTNNHLL